MANDNPGVDEWRTSFQRLYLDWWRHAPARVRRKAKVLGVPPWRLSDDDCRDLVHMVQLRLLRVLAAGGFREVGTSAAYFERAMASEIVDHFRRAHVRHESASATLVDIEPAPEPEDEPDLDGRERADAVIGALSRLPATWRAVLVAEGDGESHESTCARLGISEVNRRKQLQRARERVRRLVDGLPDSRIE